MTHDILNQLEDSEIESPVTCLGKTFPSDNARRAYYIEELRAKLSDPSFRALAGFPVGDDEDILALSDPPYQTACPNPWIGEFIQEHGTAFSAELPYQADPYASDVSEGKQDPICMAHTYHTKVPYRAIARYILHYTRPGDMVMDAFAGSGMLGVAAALCASPDIGFRETVETEWKALGKSPSWGQRFVLLSDLSPFATFLCRCFNSSISANKFETLANKLIAESKKELSWVYETEPSDSSRKVFGNYWLWTDVLFCECGEEVYFWKPTNADDVPDAVPSTLACPKCGALFTKASAKRATTTFFDESLNSTVTQNKQALILVDYVRNEQSRKRLPNLFDEAQLRRIHETSLSHEVPHVPMMHRGKEWGDMYRAGIHFGITHTHHFWTRRSLLVLSDLFSRARLSDAAHEMRFVCTSFAVKTASKMHNVGIKDKRINLAGQTYNTLQMPSISAERNIFTLAEGKIRDLRAVFSLKKEPGTTLVSTGSATALHGVPAASIDYVFIDPPFGDNIIYSELSFLYESWLRVFTNQAPEAIISGKHGKSLGDYQSLMLGAFRELYRVLKPGRWMTVAFHNSKNSVWNAIQESLGMAGFVVADVRVLDKGQGTYKQMTTLGAVKKDLVISAYKPNHALLQKFELGAGGEGTMWDFLEDHLRQLPVFVTSSAGIGEVIAERQKYLLFDRMVAFHIQRNTSVPVSATEFYNGLTQRYSERDGMYFLPEQISEYDKRRSNVTSIEQLELFVSDEKSAIRWVHRVLSETPMKKQDLQPIYMKEAQKVWEKHEKPLELETILEQNFIQADGGVWRVPDARKEADLEQLRSRALLKEFQFYVEAKGKLKVVRTEALRAGFKDAWQKKDYETIVLMAKRVPDVVVQEDPALLMYFDNASLLLGD